MTRELKLALVIGFALLLVVTVLISDHLSKARTAELSSTISESPALVRQAPTDPLAAQERRVADRGPGAPLVSDRSGEAGVREPGVREPVAVSDQGSLLSPGTRTAFGSGQPAEVAGPGTDAGRTKAPSDPVVFVQGSKTPRNTPPSAGGPDDIIAPPSMIGRSDRPLPEGTQGMQGGLQGLVETIVKGPESGARDPSTGLGTKEASKTTGQVDDASVGSKKSAPGQLPTLAADESKREHLVVNGDTLSRIARKYYGDSNAWKRIVDANPKAVGKNGEIRVGTKLTIPAKSVPVPAGKPSDGSIVQPVVRDREIAQGGSTGTASEIRRQLEELERAKGSKANEVPKTSLKNPGPNQPTPSTQQPKSAGKKSNPEKVTPSKSVETKIALAPQNSRPPVKEPVGVPAGKESNRAGKYTVKQGDTLSEIAQRELGSAARAKDILTLNKDVIGDGNSVKIGMVLKLPRG